MEESGFSVVELRRRLRSRDIRVSVAVTLKQLEMRNQMEKTEKIIQQKSRTRPAPAKFPRLAVTGEISNITSDRGGGGDEQEATNNLLRDSKDVFEENLLHFRGDSDKKKPHRLLIGCFQIR
ncbi:unnamed protein product [Microthlaspi erraticum]|uniref:Uncharacterized protein n=1 Tax=Microthlaspi erraticum TaxID=1685480 RepID=A0A6D2KNB5_9BRAS|nr:unnamed protein product [Microthlaspi erraticum]